MAATTIPVTSQRYDYETHKEEITQQLSFFDLPLETKAEIPHDVKTNKEWQYYPSDKHVSAFRGTTKNFMGKCENISDKALTCFSAALDFSKDYFRTAIDVAQPDNPLNSVSSTTQLQTTQREVGEPVATPTSVASLYYSSGMEKMILRFLLGKKVTLPLSCHGSHDRRCDVLRGTLLLSE
ncbi:hypothetical protein BDZ45DRAFT_800093 [Acephala macrosclerotiorum]|nr:hypothetical protein BDZ45DRAFT_800093 [Acephala macrosclerotiorum]